MHNDLHIKCLKRKDNPDGRACGTEPTKRNHRVKHAICSTPPSKKKRGSRSSRTWAHENNETQAPSKCNIAAHHFEKQSKNQAKKSTLKPCGAKLTRQSDSSLESKFQTQEPCGARPTRNKDVLTDQFSAIFHTPMPLGEHQTKRTLKPCGANSPQRNHKTLRTPALGSKNHGMIEFVRRKLPQIATPPVVFRRVFGTWEVSLEADVLNLLEINTGYWHRNGDSDTETATGMNPALPRAGLVFVCSELGWA
ncbi:hypothetical protein ARMSODRAFT_981829 [Armillaria solidipes]|uniref:Uncharacterized protein n=1 Tax=Armillaria solidipes TaxID=1076256 RepID=A0A2H3AU71_9AGAR|nr:hypothetical protein ARMSODRAFT_981829 [Armillaria solidipes]